MTDINQVYRNNPNLKQVNSPIQYTQDQIKEIIKCSSDPIYFIENYVHINTVDHGKQLMKLYDTQKNVIRGYHHNKQVVLLSSRQLGKCVCINTIVKIRNPVYNNGESFTCTIGEFYDWLQFRDYHKDTIKEANANFERTTQDLQ